MTGRIFFLCLAIGMAGLSQGADKEGRKSASGDDGRVRVTLSLDRLTLAPGESVSVAVTSDVLSEEALTFPADNYAPLARIFLQTPDKRLFVYPKRDHPLGANDYRNSTTLKKGQGTGILRYDLPLVDPSPGWYDAATEEPVKPNLRMGGVYEMWAVYKVAKIRGAPALAWHGSVSTDRIRFVVRDIPVADRLALPTAGQVELLNEYIASDMLSPSIPYRLQCALGRTENEGLARRMVELLRTHQPKHTGQPYPKWWRNINFLVSTRAHYYLPYGRGNRNDALKIIGPYLDEYAAVQVTELEAALDGDRDYGRFLSVDFLLLYLRHKPTSPLRERVEAWARQHAKILTEARTAKWGHIGMEKGMLIASSWYILFSLEVLHDGMTLAEAKDILGEPTTREIDEVGWRFTTGSRKANKGVAGELFVKDGREIIVFTQTGEWVKK